MDTVNYIFNEQAWIYQLILIFLLSIIIFYAFRSALKKLHQKIQLTSTIWNNALISSIGLPACLFIIITSITFMIHTLQEHTIFTEKPWVNHSINGAYITIVVLFIWRFIGHSEHMVLKSPEKYRLKDATTVTALAKLAKIITVIIALPLMVQALGYSISGLLAFMGMSGLAFGFAARDLLLNFFGGLTIYLDSPFEVGHWIRLPGHSIEGTVEYIGWRQTRLRTFDKRPLYVPNSTFANASIENPSRMQNRRIKHTIGLRYQDSQKLPALLEELRKLIHNCPDIDTSQTTFIHFNNFGEFSLECQLYCFTKTTKWTEWLNVQEKLFLDMITLIHRHDADLAFPTTTLDFTESPSPETNKKNSSRNPFFSAPEENP